ncbi:unnamed protein product [Bemisia tabaci]|uniref:Fatty acyl-CoA reductase n=1 Tax=Bemisia tabaci TaxID=7038 RepID=A0A9P0EZ05_BEMTA|nr:PREDICTED: putative fatty acyl-CoA reductase CG5065 [Bemisia tabaci]XP_018913941.1 PREDICTED: putative fatty acyl-CoA reductase CG5065 [Bemisia tabaci]CAH0382773.1 unnamed protein product [Bemisia tabaci]
MGRSEIQEFYAGKSVLVTGASGFMGKVLLEKLLRSCGDIASIYILLRPKRGKPIESRVDELTKLPLFNKIREEHPERLKKIVPLKGDVIMDNLGLDEKSEDAIINNVNIVFHGAAVLRLDAPLKDSVCMNVEGTLRILKLCRNIKNLQAFVHLSTAFCHCDHEILEERMYPPPAQPLDVISLTHWMDDECLKMITPKLLEPHPNTYTYTKRLAEKLVADEFPKMPVAIARPSIVCPAVSDPLPGWVDNLNGPVGVLIGAGKGVIRTMLCDGRYHAEIIPVDMAINGIIAVGWKTATTVHKEKEIPVYNLTQHNAKPITWGQVLENGKKIAYENPFEMMLWYPDGNIRTNKFIHNLCLFFFHWLPAYFIDFMMLIFGQKRFMLRIQGKISDGLKVLQYFTTREWRFLNDKVIALRHSMSQVDQDLFFLNFEDIEPVSYVKTCILGARVYILKEPLSSIPRCRRNLKIMWLADRTCKVLFFAMLAWLVFTSTDTIGYWLDSAKSGVKLLPIIGNFA